jgi:predicted nuclease of predicted toxin-antitoxin system
VRFIVDAQLPRALAVALTAQVSTGNMPNSVLLPLVLRNLDLIAAAFESVAYVELTTSTIISHG